LSKKETSLRILYGVQTTGNGHISRSRLMVSALKAEGHSVTTFFSGLGCPTFWDYSVFEPYSQARGLTFMTSNGQIDYAQTARHVQPFELLRDIKALDVSQYDAVISDFEPITAWAARRQKIPSIGISHQEAFRYHIPKRRGQLPARALMRYYAPTQHSIGLHWHHFKQPILPPIIETTLEQSELDASMILVYLPFENRELVCGLLRTFDRYIFRVYCDVPEVQHLGNVWLCPFHRENFLSDLRSCAGVICQAGFELPSEALHLGKKLLVKPLHRQYEQLSNATGLVKQKLGWSMDHLDAATIKTFLSAQAIEPMRYPNVAQAIAKWIGSADLAAPQAHLSLVNQLWQGSSGYEYV
jgi:uncharacterized protein (TIGR00661 family)